MSATKVTSDGSRPVTLESIRAALLASGCAPHEADRAEVWIRDGQAESGYSYPAVTVLSPHRPVVILGLWGGPPR